MWHSQHTILRLKLCLLSYKIIEGSLAFLTLVSEFIQLVLQSPAHFLQVSLAKVHMKGNVFDSRPHISCHYDTVHVNFLYILYKPHLLEWRHIKPHCFLFFKKRFNEFYFKIICTILKPKHLCFVDGLHS